MAKEIAIVPSRSDVLSALHTIAADVFEVDVDELPVDVDLELEFGANSVLMLDLGVEIERRFGVSLTEYEFAQARDVNALCGLVVHHLQQPLATDSECA